jgi:hypothetical protein
MPNSWNGHWHAHRTRCRPCRVSWWPSPKSPSTSNAARHLPSFTVCVADQSVCVCLYSHHHHHHHHYRCTVTVGHSTVMGLLHVFGTPDDVNADLCSFDQSREYLYQDELLATPKCSSSSSVTTTTTTTTSTSACSTPAYQYAFIEFEKPVTCPLQSLIIGSKFDTDISMSLYRITLVIPTAVQLTRSHFHYT